MNLEKRISPQRHRDIERFVSLCLRASVVKNLIRDHETGAPDCKADKRCAVNAAHLSMAFCQFAHLSGLSAWMAYRQFAPLAPQTTVRFGFTMASAVETLVARSPFGDRSTARA